MYDVIIIGAGIAGLCLAERLAKQKKYVLVLEKERNLGGRMITYCENGIQYEIGAGRIFHKHERMNALVKRYSLNTYPIGNYDPLFNDVFEPIVKELLRLPSSVLATKTIMELIPLTYKSLLTMYPYRAEMDLLRADLALPQFINDGVMTVHNKPTFYGVKEGYSHLIECIAKSVKKAGAKIFTKKKVLDIIFHNNLFEIIGTDFNYKTRNVVIATCRCNYKFPILQGLPLLQQLQTSPLCRIYAVFPKINGRVWFHDVEKTVTTNPLRYIIPINKETGLIMISYTDGIDTKYWADLEDTKLESAIITATKKQWPEKDIPMPTFLKKHYWSNGCTYWIPGDYDVKLAQKMALNPMPGLFLVGESVSLHQAWMESALETIDIVEPLIL
jgi:hypothetical protein